MLKLFDYFQDKDHVIWDWNGTLLSDVEHAVATINDLLAPRGLPLMDIDRYRKIFGFPIRGYYERLGFDLQAESFEALCETYVASYMSKIDRCALTPGSRELLGQVKQSGKTQSVLSATDQPNLESMLATFEVDSYFDYIFGIHDKLAAGKIARGHELMRTSGISPGRTILVGDTAHDLEVGRELGISVLLVTHGHQCAESLRQLHDNVIDISAESRLPSREAVSARS